MPKRGKRYRALLEKVDPNKVYSIEEAARILKELATA
ncbi:MAG: 50S ribosomal protein L1, partial [Thermus sp.]